ncbi:MAG: hypothetical protein RLZZ453_182 [Chlamydiota bacterium]
MTINRVVVGAVARNLSQYQVRNLQDTVVSVILPLIKGKRYELNTNFQNECGTVTFNLYRSGNVNPPNLSHLIILTTAIFKAVGGTVDNKADWSNELEDLFQVGAPDAKLPEKLLVDQPPQEKDRLSLPKIVRCASAPTLSPHHYNISPC